MKGVKRVAAARQGYGPRGGRRWVLAILCLGWAWLATGRAAEELPLVDFSQLDAAHVTRQDAQVDVVPPPAGPAWHVQMAHATRPSVTISGDWDLSAYAQVAVSIHNLRSDWLRVVCRIENAQAHEQFYCVSAAHRLAGAGTATMVIDLAAAPPPWVKVQVVGMRQKPWGGAVNGEHALDLEHVTKLVFSVESPAGESEFELRDLRARGWRPVPSPTLRDPATFFPFIDRYGQYVHRDWPGKIHDDSELQAARTAEEADLAAHPGPDSWDQYGGWQAGPAQAATGYFYPLKVGSKWWLVDPAGKLFFSTGITGVRVQQGVTPIAGRETYFAELPPRTGEFAGCYFTPSVPAVMGHYKGQAPLSYNFCRSNCQRKYGADWESTYATMAHRRLRSWGLNTIANWSDASIYELRRTPYVVPLTPAAAPRLEAATGYWGKFYDVYDPAFATTLAGLLTAERGKSIDDPWCIGYFVDNELAWGERDDELANATWRCPPTQPAKQALLAALRARYADLAAFNTAWGTAFADWDAVAANRAAPPDAGKAHADLAAFNAQVADTYFRTVRDTLKAAAPHQLYLGCRFAWHHPAAVAAAARYCDVVSFNLYRPAVASFKLPVEADVPMLIGEFHFGALDHGGFAAGLVSVADQAARGAAYTSYVQGAVQHPQFVGCHWFQYYDQATAGRPLDEENYHCGFVDVAGTPYPALTTASRALGATLYPARAREK